MKTSLKDVDEASLAKFSILICPRLPFHSASTGCFLSMLHFSQDDLLGTVILELLWRSTGVVRSRIETESDIPLPLYNSRLVTNYVLFLNGCINRLFRDFRQIFPFSFWEHSLNQITRISSLFQIQTFQVMNFKPSLCLAWFHCLPNPQNQLPASFRVD